MRQLLRFKNGQALVEFALAATLIFFLLAAAVDLGLIFFTIQGLHNAAQDGAAYGSRWLIGNSPRTLDFNAIRERVRKEQGNKGGIGFVNLLDLNNNGIPDVGPANTNIVGGSGTTYEMIGANRVIDQYIQVEMLLDSDSNGDPLNDLVNGQPTTCTNPGGGINCFIRVTAMTDYRTIFPLIPAFARTTTLRSSYILPMRDSFSAGGVAGPTPPVFTTVTPTPLPPTPIPLTVSVTRYSKVDNANPVKIKVLVQRSGVNQAGAFVTLTIGGTTYNLTDGGNGVYYNCNVGSYTGTGGPPAGSVSALAGASSGSASAGGTSESTAACP
jgi:hypothetical protein